ncbi:MAG: helix-turn-helix domain-containing protein [Microbacteriaceae bacterium]
MPETQPLKLRLGANLRSYRESRHLSQEKLAHEIGVTPRYLAGIERGERNMTLDSIDALAQKLNIDSLELIVEFKTQR